MSLKIYNTLTNQKEEFIPCHGKKVGLYACGITAYDECHLGHARASFVFDVIRKYLIFSGFEVSYVRNITDIDDKIIKKAQDELLKSGGTDNLPPTALKEKVREISEYYTACFYADMKALGINRADIEPKATGHINDMTALIKILMDKGYAYNVDGDVYFDVRKFKDYGKLSNQSIEQMLSGARKESEPGKKDPLDFALWKKAKEKEPAWPSPWSDGRPGWHIECSAMSMKYLGESFDIHAGGRDLIFPHHENEIAQSESATGRLFAKYWIHNGLLTIDGEKMSKSLGNFISVSKVLKHFHPEVLKMFFLNSHYSSPIDFSFEKMEAVNNSRQRFYILFQKIDNILKTDCLGRQNTEKGQEIVNTITGFLENLQTARTKFIEALDDNFNTPSALSILFDMVNLTNKFIGEIKVSPERKKIPLQTAKLTLAELGRIIGLFLTEEKQKERDDMQVIAKLMNIIIELRDYVRSKKDFEASDKIRQQLKETGIILEDTKGKTLWRKEI